MGMIINTEEAGETELNYPAKMVTAGEPMLEKSLKGKKSSW